MAMLFHAHEAHILIEDARGPLLTADGTEVRLDDPHHLAPEEGPTGRDLGRLEIDINPIGGLPP